MWPFKKKYQTDWAYLERAIEAEVGSLRQSLGATIIIDRHCCSHFSRQKSLSMGFCCNGHVSYSEPGIVHLHPLQPEGSYIPLDILQYVAYHELAHLAAGLGHEHDRHFWGVLLKLLDGRFGEIVKCEAHYKGIEISEILAKRKAPE